MDNTKNHIEREKHNFRNLIDNLKCTNLPFWNTLLETTGLFLTISLAELAWPTKKHPFDKNYKNISVYLAALIALKVTISLSHYYLYNYFVFLFIKYDSHHDVFNFCSHVLKIIYIHPKLLKFWLGIIYYILFLFFLYVNEFIMIY